VFIDEQKVPAVLERDDADAGALHAVAHNRFGLALGTGRLLQDTPGVARIGRMAVLPIARGNGVGAQVLDVLLHAARERGDRRAVLHAQVSAKNFYLRAGFVIDGPEFVEAGIAHVEMSKLLSPA
jgi:predicted GNAT family N-acyltransferase